MLLQGYLVWAHWASLKPKVRPAVYNTSFLENESAVETEAGTLEVRIVILVMELNLAGLQIVLKL